MHNKLIVGIPISEYMNCWLTLNFYKPINFGVEGFNGLMAMLGIFAGIGAYAITGQVIPGIF